MLVVDANSKEKYKENWLRSEMKTHQVPQLTPPPLSGLILTFEVMQDLYICIKKKQSKVTEPQCRSATHDIQDEWAALPLKPPTSVCSVSYSSKDEDHGHVTENVLKINKLILQLRIGTEILISIVAGRLTKPFGPFGFDDWSSPVNQTQWNHEWVFPVIL